MRVEVVVVLLALGVAVVAAALGRVQAVEGTGRLPNIVVLLADDLGYGDIAAYGHPTSNTPHLDKMAAEGMKFLDFYSASPVCSPSRAGVLTGRYMTRSGVYPGVFVPQSELGMPHSEITVAEALKEHHGYKTGMVGKWHLGVGNHSQYLPTTQGFDHYTGIPYSHDMPDPADCFRSDADGDLPCFPGTPPDPMKTTTPFYTGGATELASTCRFGHGMEGDYVKTAASSHATCLRACEEHADCVAVQYHGHDCRMFSVPGDTFPLTAGVVCYTQGTSSLNPSAKTEEVRASMHLGFKGTMDPVASGDEVEIPLYQYAAKETPRITQQPANLSDVDDLYLKTATDFIEEHKESPFFLYYAFQHTHHPDYAGPQFFNITDRGMMGDSLTALDWSVGQIFHTLQRLGLDNDTFVFFTSDNGPSLMRMERGGDAGPLRCGKGTTWEGGQRVPAVARWPGRIPPGSVSRDIAGHIDIFPTILSIANISLPHDRVYDGVDMSPVLFHQQPGTRDSYFYWPENVAHPSDLHAVRWREWKMHFYTGGSHAPHDYFVPSCRSNTSTTKHDPPLLFNLHHDPGEHVPLDTTDPKFKFIVAKLHNLVKEFLASPGLFGPSRTPPSNHLAQPCCKPSCLTQHPKDLNACCRTNSTAL